MAQEFGGRVKMIVEEYGNSPTAERFGVRRYPVVFVDDVLVARPKDFGFGGPEDVSGGLYVPWLDPANQRRFKQDLRRTVVRRLAAENVTGLDLADIQTAASADGPDQLPAIALRDVNGRTIDPGALAGRAVVVEMWATWCPPCRSTLAWLSDLQRRHGDRLAVIAVAVDSKPEDVLRMVGELKPAYSVVMGTPEVIAGYGAVAAVPKLFVFDSTGRRAQVLYGAPPDLHDQIEAALKKVEGKK